MKKKLLRTSLRLNMGLRITCTKSMCNAESSTVGCRCHYSAKKKAWRGQYCCVPLCHSFYGERVERKRLGMQRLSIHSFPSVTTQKGKMWVQKIRQNLGADFKVDKNTKVCSLYFTADDYISGDAMNSPSRVLKDVAVPSVFQVLLSIVDVLAMHQAINNQTQQIKELKET